MMGSRCGFSLILRTIGNFNPCLGIPVIGVPQWNIKLTDYTQTNGTPAKVLLSILCKMLMMLEKYIGHVEVQIQDCRQSSNSIFYDEWFGTAQIEGEEYRFTTDCDGLRIDEEYHVVYERTEVPTGESGIRIHDVIS